jgi:hypothetical protein
MSEHSVVVHIGFSDEYYGSYVDNPEWSSLLNALKAAVTDWGVGTFDGDDLTDEDDVILSFHGPDADSLFAAVEPNLRGSRVCVGACVAKYYGDPLDPATARESFLLHSRDWHERYPDGSSDSPK